MGTNSHRTRPPRRLGFIQAGNVIEPIASRLQPNRRLLCNEETRLGANCFSHPRLTQVRGHDLADKIGWFGRKWTKARIRSK
jgi:hypothetical protein